MINKTLITYNTLLVDEQKIIFYSAYPLLQMLWRFTCGSLAGRINPLITNSTLWGAYRGAAMKAHHSNDRHFSHCLYARYSFYTWVRWGCDNLWKNPIPKDFVCPGFHQGSNPDLSTRSPTVYHEIADATMKLTF